ncbi:putative PEP-binding protein, partial [Campylobacter sp.]|uniref:putative PEP-binding protein n=1 Tax=Campylobacter sp. TaxID=205 RepID=UPI0036206B12
PAAIYYVLLGITPTHPQGMPRRLRIIAEDQLTSDIIMGLLRASVHGQLRIMFPMVALLKEFRAAKAVFDEEKANLLAEGVAVATAREAKRSIGQKDKPLK